MTCALVTAYIVSLADDTIARPQRSPTDNIFGIKPNPLGQPTCVRHPRIMQYSIYRVRMALAGDGHIGPSSFLLPPPIVHRKLIVEINNSTTLRGYMRAVDLDRVVLMNPFLLSFTW
ncbi:uncharacterized protein BJ171DRAFT_482544 [Polychytrium aggregatum]|uniref:uncharacterized protein n=1 Tax=Polychytrium aggregatum TaxID=110093 RepID=UPI0022FE56E6|nr:uncharacterized protein BJ171DRAFT_482544 [Polychytrium aggregatum]KAI9190580.1 hypothetical protein BJ171DRAFT_482544 [Polychytrium aggregatum]